MKADSPVSAKCTGYYCFKELCLHDRGELLDPSDQQSTLLSQLEIAGLLLYAAIAGRFFRPEKQA